MDLQIAGQQQEQLLGAFESGPAGDAAREAFGRAYTAMMKREWHTIGIHLGYRYEGSPLVIADGTAEPEDTVSTYEPTSRPGHRAPHVWLSDGRSTLDLFGKGFVLLQFDRGADISALREVASARSIPLYIEEIDEPNVVKAYVRLLVLVRPDGHVAWRGDRLPEDVSELIDRVRGAL